MIALFQYFYWDIFTEILTLSNVKMSISELNVPKQSVLYCICTFYELQIRITVVYNSNLTTIKRLL